MKLKYQMRGLGIGMIVTALLMGVSAGRGIPLSDAEIRARALELGMVESDSLKLSDISNISPAPETESENTPGVLGEKDESGMSGDQGDEPGLTAEPGAGEGNSNQTLEMSGNSEKSQPAESGAAQSPEESQSAESGAAQSPGESQSADSRGTGNSEGSQSAGVLSGEEGDIVTVVIESGVTSYRICIMLEELGLVEDAAEFDTYLCDNGYSRKIDYGTHEIPVGAGEDEIAKIITRNR